MISGQIVDTSLASVAFLRRITASVNNIVDNFLVFLFSWISQQAVLATGRTENARYLTDSKTVIRKCARYCGNPNTQLVKRECRQILAIGWLDPV
jgi:hypothetical protein